MVYAALALAILSLLSGLCLLHSSRQLESRIKQIEQDLRSDAPPSPPTRSWSEYH
jgi:hypothetical protein